MGAGDHLLHPFLCLFVFGSFARGGTMIWIVIHPQQDDGFTFTGAFSNRMAAQECADEAGFFQGSVFEIDMNEVQDTYQGDKNVT